MNWRIDKGSYQVDHNERKYVYSKSNRSSNQTRMKRLLSNRGRNLCIKRERRRDTPTYVRFPK